MIFPGSNNLPETPDFPDILRPFFGSSSEKPPIFRSRPEEDPKRTRRNAGYDRSQAAKTCQNLPKPAKTGHKLPKPVQAMANSKTGDTFVPLTQKSNPWHQSQK
ncbi:hypothetical protein [Chryseobacterium gregarium]|uniref:hypothetical protein n=1 Tax=Chryseobacterium gregarium TaxID=456299 RepID=UPI0003F6F120|nr:hypothetical protein [Chryseobacterium gregarium]